MKLTSDEKHSLLPCIRRVLETGREWEDELLHHPVDAIVEAVLEIPGMTRNPLANARYGIEGFDTNGWQWDWWQHFEYQGKEYVLSGSGYYGGHSFSREEDL